MNETLLAYKSDFAAKLLAAEPDAAPASLEPQYRQRFRIYRNNLYHGLGETLGEAYPVVRRLVGNEFFMATARAFIAAHPPQEATLALYGGAFPAFLADFPPARTVPYLADIARLERARLEALHAGDSLSLSPEAMALSQTEFAAAALLPHPAMRMVASSYPIASLWRLNQASEAQPRQLEAVAETVMITRPALTVQMHLLTSAQAAFIRALTGGKTVAESYVCALHAETGFDVTTAMRSILAAGAFMRCVVPAAKMQGHNS
jgi:hypothetical protein